MKPHVPLLLLYGLLAGELATAVPITGSVGPGRHVVVEDPMFAQPVNWPLPAQGPPRHSNMTATTLLTAPYKKKKKKRSVETTTTYFNRLFPYWKIDVEVIPVMQPAEIQPDEMRFNEMQPVDEKPAGMQFAEEQSVDEKPAEEQSNEKQSAEKQSAEKQSAEKQSADQKPAEKKPTEKKPTEKKPADKKPADKNPSDKKPDGKKPADKKPDAKKADNNPSAATTTKKPSPGSQRVTKNGPFKVVSANINNPPANKQADSSSAAAATTTKKNDDSTCTDSSTFKKTEDDNDSNNGGNDNNGNNINGGSRVYQSNIANSTVDDSIISNSTVVDSRVLDSQVSDTTLLHSTVVDDTVIDDSTLEDTTVAGNSAVTEGSTLSGSDVLGGSAVAGGSTVIDSDILDGATVVDGSTVVGESLVGGGSAVAGDSNVFDGSVVTRRDVGLLAKRKLAQMPDGLKIALCFLLPFIGCPIAMVSEKENQPKRRQLAEAGSSGDHRRRDLDLLAKRKTPWMPDALKIAICIFFPFVGCPIAMSSEIDNRPKGGGQRRRRLVVDELHEAGELGKRQLVDGSGSDNSGSGSSVVSLAKRVKSTSEMTGMVMTCIFLPFLCPLYGDGREKRQLADGGSGSGSSSAVTVAKRDPPMPTGVKAMVCLLFILLCPWAILSNGKDAQGNGPEKRELADGGDDDSFGDISDIDIPIMPIIAKRLSKPARTAICVIFFYICPVVWRRGLDDAASQISSSSSDNTALGKRSAEPEAKEGALRECGAPLPWWCSNVTKRAATAEGSSSIRLLDKRKWTPAKFILCRLFFIFCFTDVATRDLAHAHAPTDTDNDDNTTGVAKKRSPQDVWTAGQWAGILDKAIQGEMDPTPPVRFIPAGDPPPDDEVDKRKRMKRSSVALDLTVDGNTVAHVAAEADGKKSPLQIVVDYIIRVVTGQVPSDPVVESKKKDGDGATKTKRGEEEEEEEEEAELEELEAELEEEEAEAEAELSSWSRRSPPAPAVEGSEVTVEGGNTDAAVARRGWGTGIGIGSGSLIIIEKLAKPIEAFVKELLKITWKRSSAPVPPPQPAAEEPRAEEESIITKRDHDRTSGFFMPPHFPGLPLSPKN